MDANLKEMIMFRYSVGMVLVILTCSLILASKGEPKKPKTSAKVQKLRGLQAQRGKLLQKQAEIRRQIEKSEATDDLREALKKAEKQYQETLKKLQAEAREKEKDAQENLQKIIAKKIADNKDVSTLKKNVAKWKERVAELQYLIELNRFQLNHRLSPVQRALENDPQLKKLYKDIFSRKPNASKIYHDARQAKLKSLPEAKKLLSEIEKAEKEREKTEQDIRKAEDQLRKLIRFIETGEDEDIQAARKQHSQARQDYFKVFSSEEIRKLQAKRSEASRNLQKKFQELIDNDKSLKKLQLEIRRVEDQIRAIEIEREIEALQKKLTQLKKRIG